MATTLEERRKKNKQAEARLAADEAAANIVEKKARHHRLIELGARCEKHALAGFDDDTREGALEELDRVAKDPKNIQRWAKAGREKRALLADVRVIVIKFAALSPEGSAALKDKGFRLNRLLGQWEAKTNLFVANELAALYGGFVQVVGEDTTAPPEVQLAAE
jgi:hypothetical protein